MTDASPPPEAPLARLVRERSVLVCCGSGGVGKTTTSAALALLGARAGRRTCVVTIDPARRLADALGLGALSNEPTRVDGPWPGELWAVMLDAKGTFDRLVERHSREPAQAERILANRLYRNLTSALAGTQEYMAMEKLYELHSELSFELVVVDTPPTRHALDFLDAPRRLARFLENRVFRVLLMPTRTYLKAVSLATQTLLHTIARVVGSEIVDDAVAFFRAFEGMEEGFRSRARHVERLLADPGTAFVLVTTPRPAALAEARFFADKLARSRLPTAAVVANRVHPHFGPGLDGAGGAQDGVGTDEPRRAASPPGAGAPEGWGPGGAGPEEPGPAGAFECLVRNLEMLERLAQDETGLLAALAADVAPAPVVTVPLLDEDVHDLVGVESVARHLLGEPLASPRAQGAARQ
jgi:anion-transporting  ArsA/GET3 family ATPase